MKKCGLKARNSCLLKKVPKSYHKTLLFTSHWLELDHMTQGKLVESLFL